MSLSQFTKYTSSDASGPGPITGQAGKLITVLDACLVNGYTGKAAAGWTKPYANTSNTACYKQGAGSGFGFAVNDDAYTVANEFYGAGFQTLTGVNTGTGGFPGSSSGVVANFIVGRKSASADSTPRNWVLFADASTFYLLILTGDTAGKYYDFSFGDFYSLNNGGDSHNAFICGRMTANSSSTGSQSSATQYGSLDYTYSPRDEGVLGSAAIVGWWIANNVAGTSGPLGNYYRFGDTAKSITPYALYGSLPTPNSYDSSYYLSPIFVMDSSGAVRGFLRGFYHVCHAVSGFTDGQTFSGANDFAGKSFELHLTAENGGMFCFETSATVNTN